METVPMWTFDWVKKKYPEGGRWGRWRLAAKEIQSLHRHAGDAMEYLTFSWNWNWEGKCRTGRASLSTLVTNEMLRTASTPYPSTVTSPQKAIRSFKHTVSLINPVSSFVWLEMAFRGSPQRMRLTNLYSALDQLLNRTGDLRTKHL